MAVHVLKDARVEVNSVVLSDHAKRVKISYTADDEDTSKMGDSSKTCIPSLKEWSVEVEFEQDYDASKVDATLFSLIGAPAFPIKIRPTSAAISPTNPEFQGNAILKSYPPVDGSHGKLHVVTASFKGTGELARATTA